MIKHVYAIQRDTMDGLYLFESERQAHEYGARFGLEAVEHPLLDEEAGAQFLIDTYDPDDVETSQAEREGHARL